MLESFYDRGRISAQNPLLRFFIVRANTDFAKSYGYGRLGNSFPIY